MGGGLVTTPLIDPQLDHNRAVRRLLQDHGSANQYERWEAGLLPEHELLALARNLLFSPFRAFTRWAKLNTFDMQHDDSCSGGSPTYSTREPRSLTHDEWALFKSISDAVSRANSSGLLQRHGATASVSVVEHVGRCSVCSVETYGRAANIRIEWAGRPLSREYTLEGKQR